MVSDVKKKKQNAFTTIITAKLGDSMAFPTPPVDQPSLDEINDYTYDSRESDEDEHI